MYYQDCSVGGKGSITISYRLAEKTYDSKDFDTWLSEKRSLIVKLESDENISKSNAVPSIGHH